MANKHPVGRALTSDLLTSSLLTIVYEIIFLNLSPNSLFKARLIFCLSNNYFRAIKEPVRNECSSCRVLNLNDLESIFGSNNLKQ